MRSFKLIIALVFVAAVAALGQITPGVSPVNCIQSTATVHTCAQGALSVNSGDVIYLCQVLGLSSDVSTAPTDGVNTYTELIPKTQGNVTGTIWKAIAASTTSLTITCNISADTKFVCGTENYSSVTSVGSQGTSVGQAAGPATITYTQSTTANNSFIVGCFGSSVASNLTVNTGTQRIGSVHTSATSAASMGVSDNTAASPSSVNVIENIGTGGSSVALGLELLAGVAPTGRPSTLPLLGVGQ